MSVSCLGKTHSAQSTAENGTETGMQTLTGTESVFSSAYMQKLGNMVIFSPFLDSLARADVGFRFSCTFIGTAGEVKGSFGWVEAKLVEPADRNFNQPSKLAGKKQCHKTVIPSPHHRLHICKQRACKVRNISQKTNQQMVICIAEYFLSLFHTLTIKKEAPTSNLKPPSEHQTVQDGDSQCLYFYLQSSSAFD